MKVITISIFILCSSSALGQITFNNHRVYRLLPQNFDQIKLISQLDNDKNYNFWTSPSVAPGKPIDVMVSPKVLNKFNLFLDSNNINATIFIENVQNLIDNENLLYREGQEDFGWTAYHSLEEINTWLSSLVEKHPKLVTLIKTGKSYERRELTGVHVSFNKSNENNAIFIEAGIHAREWVSSATATWILNQILINNNTKFRAFAERYDWYFVPVVNPDGFAYTKSKDRMWRKTRTPSNQTVCRGADPNRNWDWHWNEGGASRSPCSDVYNGRTSFSEPSVKSLANYIESISKKLIGYVSFHSYSQLIMAPYGYTSEHLDNFDLVNELMKAGSEAAATRYGTKYRYGNIVEVLYRASGSSLDWVKGKFETPVVIVYELRDRGHYGFLLPADQIAPTSEETLDSLVAVFDEYEKRK